MLVHLFLNFKILLSLKIFNFYLMCVDILLVCMSMHHSHACRGQQGVLGPLELELQMFVSYHVGDGNQTQVL